jgi:hypothetical protein
MVRPAAVAMVFVADWPWSAGSVSTRVGQSPAIRASRSRSALSCIVVAEGPSPTPASPDGDAEAARGGRSRRAVASSRAPKAPATTGGALPPLAAETTRLSPKRAAASERRRAPCCILGESGSRVWAWSCCQAISAISSTPSGRVPFVSPVRSRSCSSHREPSAQRATVDDLAEFRSDSATFAAPVRGASESTANGRASCREVTSASLSGDRAESGLRAARGMEHTLRARRFPCLGLTRSCHFLPEHGHAAAAATAVERASAAFAVGSGGGARRGG